MEVIKLHHPYQPNEIDAGPVVLAMGFFDGLHLGHQAVIEAAKAEANKRGIKLAVLTYDHHPSIAFKTYQTPFTYITTLNKKLALMEKMGVDLVYVVNFTSQFAALAPQDFVEQYMLGLNAEAVVAGFDHTYGPVDAGMAELPTYAQGRFDVIEVPAVAVAGHESASTLARQYIDEGQVGPLVELLGRVYETTGIVVHGEARGREMGFPTANIETTAGERLPGIGVYAVELKVGDQWYPGMASIGYNVTFGANRPKTVEINLFDFHEQIYGENVVVRWHQYLRTEVEFTGMERLIEQLKQDEMQVRAFFETRR